MPACSCFVLMLYPAIGVNRHAVIVGLEAVSLNILDFSGLGKGLNALCAFEFTANNTVINNSIENLNFMLFLFFIC
jgi:hypothetical protein